MTRAATAGAPAPQMGPLDFENVPIPKPQQDMSLGGQQDGIPFEADQHFEQAPIYPNGRAPDRQQYGTQQAADIALGEQGLLNSHRVVQARPGVFEIRPTAAPQMRMVQPGIYEAPKAQQSAVPNAPSAPASEGLPAMEAEQLDEPAPVTPIQTLTPEQRRAGVDPLTGEVPPPPPFNPIPPAPDAAPDEPNLVKGPDSTARATFDTEQEARDYISAGRKADRSIAISHQPVQLPDGRWTLALPGEPGHKGAKIKARMDGAGIPGQDAILLDPNTAKPWRTKQAASKFNKTVDGYEVLQQPDNGWVLQQKVQGAAPEAQPGMSVSQEAPKDAASPPIEFSAEDRSRIEGLFADGKNGAQIAKTLDRTEPQADVLRAVGALRKELGIPGVSEAEAFKAWRESRKTKADESAAEQSEQPQPDSASEPTVASPPEATTEQATEPMEAPEPAAEEAKADEAPAPEPVEQSQPETENQTEPSNDGASASPATTWDDSSQAERFETLKAAGWGFGKAGPSASAKQTAAKTWDTLTDSQKTRIGAAMAPKSDGQIITSEESLKDVATVLEKAGMKPMTDADGNLGRVFELDVGSVSVVRAEVVSAMGQPQKIEVSARVPTQPTQTDSAMTPEAAAALAKDFAAKIEQFRQKAAENMAASRVETKPEAIQDDTKPADDVAAVAGSPAEPGPGPAPDTGAGEPSVGSGTDDARGAVDRGPSEPVASAAEAAPAGSDGDGAAAVAETPAEQEAEAAPPKPADVDQLIKRLSVLQQLRECLKS
jgi:hypothetical protein